MNSLVKVLSNLMKHPLSTGNKFVILKRFILWQILKNRRRSMVVPWVNNTKLLIEKGRSAATGNYYLGVLEFEEMSFVMHYLCENDTLLDIGGNIGIYPILGSGICKAKTITVEPCPSTCKILLENVKLNCLEELVEVHNIGIAREAGYLQFTMDDDSMNHCISKTEKYAGRTSSIPVKTVDDLIGNRKIDIMKVDVEGFEMEVLLGGPNMLKSENLNVILLEINGEGEKYSYSNSDIYNEMLKWNFIPCSYKPFTRKITKLDSIKGKENIIFIRNISLAQMRCNEGEKYRIYNWSI